MKMLRKCCCFSLYKGGLFITWLGIFGSILYGILGIIGGQYVIEFGEHEKINGKTSADRIGGQHLADYGVYIIVSLVIGSIFSCIVNILGFYGIVSKKHNFLLPWLVLHAFAIFSSVLTILILSVVMIAAAHFERFFDLLLIGGVSLVPSIYFWLVMYTLYKNIRADRIYNRSRSEINTYVVEYPNPIKE